MEKREDAHLSPGELDAVLEVSFGREARVPEGDELFQARQHLAACEICRSRVAMHAVQQSRLELLKAGTPAGPGPDCPPESEWPWIAAGLKVGTEVEASLSHAARCDHCGPLLRQAMADFADDATEEEEAALAELECNRPDWQAELCGKLSNQPRRAGFLARFWEYLTPARAVPVYGYAGGVAVLAVASLLGVRMLLQPPIENLLATAYTDQRTLELRIPSAAYAPLRLVRGSTGRSRLDRPAALLEGEARIARELAKNPHSPRWLQARGRAELLDRDFGAAIASLQRSLDLQPNSQSLLTDLASAYFERAEANSSQTDYGTAVELLSRTLKMRPDDPVALFNRAIVYERMHLYDQAIEDWRHYLRVDANSAWIREARQRLSAVEQIKKSAA